jgi:hypothetical protein
MKLKISKQIAIEKGIELENSDIKLLGCECLCECDKNLSDFIKHNSCCNTKNSFKKIFGFNTKFYYKIEKYDHSNIMDYEVGIGYLEKDNKDIVLKRVQPLFFSKDKAAPCPSFAGCVKFNCECDHHFVAVSNYFPDNYLQVLPDSNCIIASIDKHIPSPVYVDKNSVVGRLDNDIQSIDISSLLNQIIKYDEATNTVQFFNGQRWIKLVERVDEDPT